MSPTPPTAEVVIDGASDDVVEAEGLTSDGRDEGRGRSSVIAQVAQAAASSSAQTTAQSTATTTAEPDHGTTHGTSSADAVTHDESPPAKAADEAPLNPYMTHDDTPDTPDTPDTSTDNPGDHAADGTDSTPE